MSEEDEIEATNSPSAKMISELEREIAEMRHELDKLRLKNSRMRTELRLLNKTRRSMWDGVRFSARCRDMEAKP